MVPNNKHIGIIIENPTVLGGVQRVTKNLIDLLKVEFKVDLLISLYGNTSECLIDYGVKIEKISDINTSNFKELIDKYNLTHIIIQLESIKRELEINRALNKLNCKVINVLHSSPYPYFKKYGGIKRTLSSFRNMAQYLKMQFYWKRFHYNAFTEIVENSGIICVSDASALELQGILNHKYDKRITSIPNPLTFKPKDQGYVKKNSVVYAGRLFEDKMPILMLDVWNNVCKGDYKDWNFYILGDGPARAKMEAYVNKFNILNVHFCGIVSCVDEYLKESKITLLFSYYEGLPTILLEAASFHNAILATNGDGGITDIVKNKITGELCNPNLEELSKSLQFMMKNEKERVAYANNAFNLLNDYSEEEILAKWREVLN